MRLDKAIALVVIVIIVFFLWKSITAKNTAPVQNTSGQKVYNQTNYGLNDKKKNALDVIAPQYKKSQKEVQSIQKLRQQALKEEQNTLNSAEIK